jgi:hypothetical protein
MHRAFALALLSGMSAIAAWTTTALAAPPQLKGQYAFTGMATCEFSGQPFSVTQPPTITPPDQTNISNHTTLFAVPLQVPPGTPNGVFSNTFNIQGVRTFDGNGHGTVDATSVEVSNVTQSPRVSASSVHFEFTYTVDGAGGLTTQLAHDASGNSIFKATDLNLDGSPSGSTWTIDQFSLVGMIGNNNSVITLANALPEIETQTFLTGPQAGTSRQRICSRSRTLVWLGN